VRTEFAFCFLGLAIVLAACSTPGATETVRVDRQAGVGMLINQFTSAGESEQEAALDATLEITIGAPVRLGGGFVEGDAVSIGDEARTCEVDTYFFVSTVSG